MLLSCFGFSYRIDIFFVAPLLVDSRFDLEYWASFADLFWWIKHKGKKKLWQDINSHFPVLQTLLDSARSSVPSLTP